MEIQGIKQRFGIVGTSPLLDRAIEIARQVAPTDLTVLISGESGSGKEVFSHIIHALSARKHGPMVAVNCGAIPEGTIDSELFGHEKGSFTGAHESRKGYFETADKGTIFLDEVGELPLSTQSRLLRVLESGEFIKVGSSKTLKTDVRVVAATNVDLTEAVADGRFREDLYYRLNTVPLKTPALRDRKEDIHLLFRKFVADFSDRNRIPPVKLDAEAVAILEDYSWPGNVRQLKNLAEQICILSKTRDVGPETLKEFIPDERGKRLPVKVGQAGDGAEHFSERDILYRILFEMRRDMQEMKQLVLDIVDNGGKNLNARSGKIVERFQGEIVSGEKWLAAGPDARQEDMRSTPLRGRAAENDAELEEQDSTEGELFSEGGSKSASTHRILHPTEHAEHQEVEETLSLADAEKQLIRKALDKHQGKRKQAADELGISERTLYRKIKEYGLMGLFALLMSGCSYSFTGASIEPDTKSYSVESFENTAALVVPGLDQQLAEKVRRRIENGTPLNQNDRSPDLLFKGTVTDYRNDPVAVTGTETAAKNRLSVTVYVECQNLKDDNKTWKQTFSRFADYDASADLASVEQGLLEQITQELAEDIFNRAFVNW